MLSDRFDIRWRRYVVGGARAEHVITSDLQVTIPIGDTSTTEAAVPTAVFGSLPTVAEVALEVFDGDEWREPDNCRFLVRAVRGDEREPTGTQSMGGVNIVDWLLRKNYLQQGEGELNADGHRPFNSATPGAIIKTILDEAQARGWAPFLSYDFDADEDSNGDPWESVLTIGYQPGRVHALTILQNLLDQGVVERSTRGRMLRLFNPGTGADLTTGDAPVRVGMTAVAMPVERNIDDLVTHLSFYGEGDFTLEVENVGAYAGLGRLETAIVQGGVNDEGTATLLGQTALERGKQVREAVVATEPADSAVSLPWIHYQPGDWVQGRRGSGAWERMRGAELVVLRNADADITVSLQLNDRFLDLIARLAKRTNGILGGAVAGGTGATPNPGPDTRQPKAPTGLVGSSGGYWDPNGASVAQVSLEWAAVTQGTNDVAIEVDGYEVWGRLDDGATPWSSITFTDETEAFASPFEPGTDWLFKVRAQSKAGVWGAFSDELPITMSDADPDLEQPAAPVVTSRNAVVVVQTTGLFDTDPPTTAPLSFREFRIERSSDEAGPYTIVGVLTRDQDSRVFNDMAIGDTWWWRLVAIDRLGRESAPSDAVSVLVVGVDGADLIVNTLHGNRIIAGTIEASAVVSGFGAAIELDENVTIIAQQAAIDGVAADVGTVAGDVAAVDSNLATMQTYYQFGPDGAIITSPGSDYSQRIASDRTEMRQGAQVVSYWEAGQMFVPRLVTDRVVLGNHQWEKAGSAGSVIRALS